uniref:Galectin n=1 Tax=Meloidogyne enterolobii TaxID=390850 RepID=A0A6V7X7F7_MELEN|nr:unnamed protein product [Meloidogyne enterolobii]
MNLKVPKEYFKLNRITLNNENDYSIPIRYLNYIDGETNKSIKIYGGAGLLSPGDRLIFKGNVPINAKEFHINFCYLQRNCVPQNTKINQKIGENILNIRFVFDSKNIELKNKLILKYCKNTKNKADCKKELTKVEKNPISPDSDFTLTIDINYKNFIINVDNGEENITIKFKSERRPSFTDYIQKVMFLILVNPLKFN